MMNSDLISREAALACFREWIDQHGDVHTPDEMAEYRAIEELSSVQPESCEDAVSRKKIFDTVAEYEKQLCEILGDENELVETVKILKHRLIALPSVQPEIIRCKDCKHWRQQTNYQGASLSFGFCESDDMWRSLYGETTEVAHIDTDDNHYCGYAERRTE